MDIIKAIEAKQIKENAENFSVGDTVRVSFKIVEGATERIQVFEGIVIAKNNSGIRRTFIVRKIWCRSRENLPASLSTRGEDRGRQKRTCQKGKALLPPRQSRQGS